MFPLVLDSKLLLGRFAVEGTIPVGELKWLFKLLTADKDLDREGYSLVLEELVWGLTVELDRRSRDNIVDLSSSVTGWGVGVVQRIMNGCK